MFPIKISISTISYLAVTSYGFQNDIRLKTIRPSYAINKNSINVALNRLAPLPMSSIPDNNEEGSSTIDSYGFHKKKKSKSWRDALPPMPEDHIILTGDIFSLFVYCFMDHITDDIFSEDSMLHALVTSSPQSIQVPVWADISNNFGSSLLREIMNQQQIAHIGNSALLNPDNVPIPHYVPIFLSPGVSFVLFTSAWILSGYFNRSFSFSNGIQSDPAQAINIVFKTWIFTAAMMFSIALLSGQICGCDFIGSVGMSKSDIEFIFDSLTVLAVWRFVVASMLNAW